ncbi:MAG: hypothetical protein WCC90_16320 [Methylocella sp.]
MSKNIPPKALKDLRHHIAAVISDEKAYNVPSVCVRYGMADGGTDEAFASKNKYVMSRAQQLTADKLLEVAKALYHETGSFELSETLAKIEESTENLVSELTRRHIVDALDIPFSARTSELEFLEKLWPIGTMRPPPGSENVADSMTRFINYQLLLNVGHNHAANKAILEGLGMALSHCRIERVAILLARLAHAAATTSCHVCIAEARKARCVLADAR